MPQPVRTVPNFLAALHRHILGLFSVHVSWLGYPRFIPLPASFGSLSGLILQWFWNVAPSLQWRDRAGFAPASILASRVMDREEHRIVDEIVTAMPRLLFFFRYTSFPSDIISILHKTRSLVKNENIFHTIITHSVSSHSTTTAQQFRIHAMFR